VVNSKRSTPPSVCKAENLTSPDFAVSRGLEIVLKVDFLGEGGMSRPSHLGDLVVLNSISLMDSLVCTIRFPAKSLSSSVLHDRYGASKNFRMGPLSASAKSIEPTSGLVPLT
jgi:hypothetical protein